MQLPLKSQDLTDEIIDAYLPLKMLMVITTDSAFPPTNSYGYPMVIGGIRYRY